MSAWKSRCETPKSPPGDYNILPSRPAAGERMRVKHLNPRQGITTRHPDRDPVRHFLLCETPKSPPGDYNTMVRVIHSLR